MSFKLLGMPSIRAWPHELADFAECVTLLHGECSARLVERLLGQLDDNASNEGIEDSDLTNEEQQNAGGNQPTPGSRRRWIPL